MREAIVGDVVVVCAKTVQVIDALIIPLKAKTLPYSFVDTVLSNSFVVLVCIAYNTLNYAIVHLLNRYVNILHYYQKGMQNCCIKRQLKNC